MTEDPDWIEEQLRLLDDLAQARHRVIVAGRRATTDLALQMWKLDRMRAEAPQPEGKALSRNQLVARSGLSRQAGYDVLAQGELYHGIIAALGRAGLPVNQEGPGPCMVVERDGINVTIFAQSLTEAPWVARYLSQLEGWMIDGGTLETTPEQADQAEATREEMARQAVTVLGESRMVVTGDPAKARATVAWAN